jgi:hypothetical protein
LRGFLAIWPFHRTTPPLSTHHSAAGTVRGTSMGRKNQPSVVPPVHHLLQHYCTTHHSATMDDGATASLLGADSQPCTTAANPLPGVPTRSSGELQMRPPGCVCRRQIRSDSHTSGSSCSSCSSCSSSACQTTLTRGFVLPIVCSAKA